MPADTKVCIAYLHGTEVSHSWHVSYTETVLYDMRPNGPWYLRGGWLAQFGSEAGFDDARNKVAKEFLDNRDAEWLWWVDSDMGWQPDALEKLMAVADPIERPIVGGLCFGNRPAGDDRCNGNVFRLFPTIYALDERDDAAGFSPIMEYPPNELIQCGGTGSAFVLIHRSVFEKIRDKFGDFWYTRIKHPKNDIPFGEDLSFCLRATVCDVPIHVHTGIRTNHLKFHYLSEAQFFTQLEAPPATEPVDVIVPVLHRPQNVKPLMDSLRASTGLATAWFVCDEGDLLEQAAVQKAGGNVLVKSGTFAQKVNYAFDQVQLLQAPWVLLVGDDVRFHPGWLDHAQHVAKWHDAKVIGTNDVSNPRVMDGEHATHMLISRDYILDQGASWDEPGAVCHEGYGHMFVDDEIVTAAKQRGVWAFAYGSVIDHLHPLWGKGEMDEVYAKGQATAKADQALFERRFRKYVEAT